MFPLPLFPRSHLSYAPIQPAVPAQLVDRNELWSILNLSTVIGPNTVVFVCQQTLFKLTPEFDQVFRCVDIVIGMYLYFFYKKVDY